jgi:hypothetical protein
MRQLVSGESARERILYMAQHHQREQMLASKARD